VPWWRDFFDYLDIEDDGYYGNRPIWQEQWAAMVGMCCDASCRLSNKGVGSCGLEVEENGEGEDGLSRKSSDNDFWKV